MAGYEGFTKLGNGLWIDNRTQKIGTLKPTGRGGWYVEEITKLKFKRKDVQERQAREKYEKLEDEWNKAYQPYKNGWKVNPKEDKALMDLAKRHDEALENMKSKYTQAEVDTIKAKVARFKERKGATKDNTISKSVSQLKNMYKNATEDEKAKIRAELNSRGYYRKNGRWATK